jgi:hypothetical protein
VLKIYSMGLKLLDEIVIFAGELKTNKTTFSVFMAE